MGSIVLIIFLMFLVPFIIAPLLHEEDQEDTLEELAKESERVGEALTSPPYPENWDGSSEEIVQVGLLQNGIIDSSILESYSELDYSRTKLLMGTSDEYLFFFEDKNGLLEFTEGGVHREYFGWNGNNSKNGGSNLKAAENYLLSSANSLAKDERFIVMEHNGEKKEVKMITYVWDFADGMVDLNQVIFSIDYLFSSFLLTTKDNYAIGEEVYLTG